MRFSILFFILVLSSLLSRASFAPPLNDELINAINLPNTSAFCSDDAAYSNLEATSSAYGAATGWPAVGKDVWFKFIATKYDVNISVSGQVNAASTNTLIAPLVSLYSYDPITRNVGEMVGSFSSSNNVTSFYKGALILGEVYYVRVSAQNNNVGTFKLCVDNYFPIIKPGQDCGTVSVLCTKESFTQLNVTGAGANRNESAGTCLGTESNSAWYMFTASKSGDFTFVITPTVTTNDIDWVFYDLGIGGNCNNVNSTTAIRCASGSGVTCTPTYYKTGLSLTETDLNEASGCVPGQNGFVKYVDLVEGHTYALLVDNFSSGNNGFTLEFGGTADFAGPTANIKVDKLNPCTDNQAYVFESNSTNYASLKWSFGEGANIASATTEGPFTITYSTPGEKVVVLEAKATNGCNVVTTQNFIVAKTPAKPNIVASKVNLCIDDVLNLSTDFLNLATYHWSGPNGFSSTLQNPVIPITGIENIGTYTLFVQVGDCISPQASVDVVSVVARPEALFSIQINNKCESNQSFSFINNSKNYTKLNWDFGTDVKTTTALTNDSKELTFSTAGLKTITLTVETNNGCTSSITQTLLVELKPASPQITVNQPAFCINDTIKLSVPQQDAVSYAWTGPDQFKANTNAVEIPVSNLNKGGTYQVVITSGTCSSDPSTLVIPAIAKMPVAGFYTEPSFDIKFSAPVIMSFINTSLYADYFLWDFGDGFKSTDVNPSHQYEKEGTFKITLTASSKNGCFTSVTKGDLVIKGNASAFAPNAFSPNGDGVNDEFVIGITNLKKYRIQIYNRYGDQVFFSTSIFDNWKGTFKGNDLPTGVYYYLILGTNLKNESVKHSGSVTLLR